MSFEIVNEIPFTLAAEAAVIIPQRSVSIDIAYEGMGWAPAFSSRMKHNEAITLYCW